MPGWVVLGRISPWVRYAYWVIGVVRENVVSKMTMPTMIRTGQRGYLRGKVVSFGKGTRIGTTQTESMLPDGMERDQSIRICQGR